MSPSVVLQDVSYVTADGRLLFSSLNLNLTHGTLGVVGNNGVGKSTLLGLIADDVKPSRGAISVTGKIATLAQTHDLTAETSISDLFGISEAWKRLDRIESGNGNEQDFELADWDLAGRLDASLQAFGLPNISPRTPISTLSGGQRTRAALAAITFNEPDIILLDEPTNNLDRNGRKLVVEFLERWRGLAVVVSHDRELLRAVHLIAELSPNRLQLFGGNWDFYYQERARQRADAAQQLEQAQRQVVQVRRKVQEAAERQARKDASGRKSRFSAGAPKILLDARAERAENTGGRGNKLAERQVQDAESRLKEAEGKVERSKPIRFEVTAPAATGKELLNISNLTCGYCPDAPVIRNVSLQVVGPERLVIIGANGAGKSTLLRLIAGQLSPIEGKISLHGRSSLFDQELHLLDPHETLLANFRRINTNANDNDAYAALARFAFRNEDALRYPSSLSGGEKLRAALACILGGTQEPELLLLDEPTNHLDLKSIEELEAALKNYKGALIVVSHDLTFLENLEISREIEL